MEPFTVLEARGVALMMDDIDTDMLFPAQYCKTLSSDGLGRYLFARERYAEFGGDFSRFPLNQPQHEGASILVAGRNFGCGSSREHAVWALRDFGFRCVIAESFSDILYGNCFKNGILPVALERPAVDAFAQATRERPETLLRVDLKRQRAGAPGLGPFAFRVEPHRREMLLKGLDEVGITLARADAIAAFEARHFADNPWIARTNEG